MKLTTVIVFFLFCQTLQAQELFVYTEPASNVPAKSLGLRLTQQIANQSQSGAIRHQVIPEVVIGASHKLMLHGEAFINRNDNRYSLDGGSLFIKYRFLSHDAVHRHFRMAAFGMWAYNRSAVIQPALDFNGMNSGWQGGLTGTKLVDRLAISTSVSWMHAWNNGSALSKLIPASERNALAYSVSAGRLIFPVEYRDYEQPNLNLMLELLGQTKTGSGRTFIDMAPSVQIILKSRMRLDVGYRFPLVDKLNRGSAYLWLVRFEYNLFNAFH